jgi:hypothetical protein
MNHYKVNNGYIDVDGLCYQDVYATNEADAIEEAVKAFKEEAQDMYKPNPDYWNKDNFVVSCMYEGLVCCKCKGEDQ